MSRPRLVEPDILSLFLILLLFASFVACSIYFPNSPAGSVRGFGSADRIAGFAPAKSPEIPGPISHLEE